MNPAAEWRFPTLSRIRSHAGQRAVGLALAVAAFTGIVFVRTWFSAEPLADLGHWAGYVSGQTIYAALIAFFVWSLWGSSHRIAFLLVFGILLAAIFTYHGFAVYAATHARGDANRILIGLREGERRVDDLTEGEMSNPYVEAFLVMRDVYWELHERADGRMAHYRRLHAEYTRHGAFLDSSRLGSAYGLWHSYIQVRDLQYRLVQAQQSEPNLSDLLWTVTLLDVDSGTRASYADDLRRSAKAIADTQSVSIAREGAQLSAIRLSLEALIDAQGRYRIDGAQIIFDRPEDAARFSGAAADTGER